MPKPRKSRRYKPKRPNDRMSKRDWKKYLDRRRFLRRQRKRVMLEQARNRDFNVTIRAQVKAETLRRGSPYEVHFENVPSRSAVLIVKNPWRPKRPPGNVPTARTLSFKKIVNGANSRSITNGIYTYNVSGPDTGPLAATNASFDALTNELANEDSRLRTEAVLDAMQSVKDQKWNAGVMLAESQGTAKMAMELMQLIASTRKLLRKGEFEAAYLNFKKEMKRTAPKGRKFQSYPEWRRKHYKDYWRLKSVQQSKTVPSGWLYYHFGIQPTISDITGIVEESMLTKAPGAFDRGGIARGYARKTVKRAPVDKTSFTKWGYSTSYTEEGVRSVRVAINVLMKPSFAAKLSTLGVLNPPEAAWNAVPFSWVVDYFTSFGDWLSVLDTGLGWQFSETWTESWRTVAYGFHVPKQHTNCKYSWPAKGSAIYHKSLNRVVKKDPYGPMGTILPSFKRKGPSLKQYTNLLAVVATSMKMTIRP